MNVYAWQGSNRSCPYCNFRGSDSRPILWGDDAEDKYYACKNCDELWMETDMRGKISREKMMHWRPMKAATFNMERHKEQLFSDDYVIEKKLNGDRVLAVYDKTGGQFFTRTLSVADGLPVEKTDWLPHLGRLRTGVSCILDGEIVVAKKSDHAKVGSIFNCGVEKSLIRQAQFGKLIYVVFDCLMYDAEDLRGLELSERLPYRRDALNELCSQLQPNRCMAAPKLQYIRKVPVGKGASYVKKLLESGEEGVIVKDLASKYTSDKRPTSGWLKIKQQADFDLFIIGYKAAKEESVKSSGKLSSTKYAGMIGSVELGVFDGTKVVSVCHASGIPDDLRQTITANPKAYLNMVVEVTCQKITKDKHGKLGMENPRIKLLREDKNKEECQLKLLHN